MAVIVLVQETYHPNTPQERSTYYRGVKHPKGPAADSVPIQYSEFQTILAKHANWNSHTDQLLGGHTRTTWSLETRTPARSNGTGVSSIHPSLF